MNSTLPAEATDQADAEKVSLDKVDTTAGYGHASPVRMRMPIFIGDAGPADLARQQGAGLAAGAAICGISLVVAEDLSGLDPRLELDQSGHVVRSPELERRVEAFRHWQDGYGDILVQTSAKDMRLGVAEYAVRELGVEAIELTWGRGATGIGSGSQVCDLDQALQLSRRGYACMPNPEDPTVQAAFHSGTIRGFERHWPMGFVDEDNFRRTVEYLRCEVGVKRVSLMAAVCGQLELAMAMKWSSEARVDLLTIDPGDGSFGMSPRQGSATFDLQGAAHGFAKRLAARGQWIPHLAMAGGFSTSDDIFKVIALGAPYFRAVRIDQATMAAGFVGDDIEGAIPSGGDLPWKDLPPAAFAMHVYVDALRTGLAKLMAGAGSSRLDALGRSDIVAQSEEATGVPGISYAMEADLEEAERILDHP